MSFEPRDYLGHILVEAEYQVRPSGAREDESPRVGGCVHRPLHGSEDGGNLVSSSHDVCDTTLAHLLVPI